MVQPSPSVGVVSILVPAFGEVQAPAAPGFGVVTYLFWYGLDFASWFW
jgi:hypothetical protein